MDILTMNNTVLWSWPFCPQKTFLS